MSKVMSVRLSDDVLRRLRRSADAASESASGLAARLVDEGLRLTAHPGIVFKSGPGGRRAALIRGPDVWQVVSLLRSLEVRGDKAVAAAAEWLNLTDAEIRVALAYYGEFSDEIDRWIKENERAAERARRSLEKQHRVIG
jgi:predicted transcriptional regulator